jgi:Family of unknown function (DUF5681)
LEIRLIRWRLVSAAPSPNGSGNPKGRPRGSKNLSTLVIEAADNRVAVNLDGKQRFISRAQATVLQLANRAVEGEPKAIIKFLDLIDEMESRHETALPVESPFTKEYCEVIDQIYQRMLLCNSSKKDDSND